ncbi:DUF4180 domain-containing protein [Rhizobium sp. CF142]|uniref:DUF4180 domain-containing protein n=1 Tax=Rhizobium sp. CF142 TaxID=1144314 RepID=UPI00026EED30|nr:DUF4180 domain-containing protein [Rhizobium sp. CF142]EJJ29601.1 hypothetical protein PMI11_02082 [Rhizobium sp. CF142]
MSNDIRLSHGFRVLLRNPDGKPLSAESGINDLIGQALGEAVDWVVLPVARLPEGFLTLRSGIAGAAIQKFVNYKVRIAIIGRIDAELAASKALQSFVLEANRGTTCWFLDTMEEFEAKLSAFSTPA